MSRVVLVESVQAVLERLDLSSSGCICMGRLLHDRTFACTHLARAAAHHGAGRKGGSGAAGACVVGAGKRPFEKVNKVAGDRVTPSEAGNQGFVARRGCSKYRSIVANCDCCISSPNRDCVLLIKV